MVTISNYIFYYDGFSEFESVIAALLFREKLSSVALEKREYVCEERQTILPEKTIDELNADDIELLIIPGGNPSPLFDNEKLREFITKLNEKQKYIAGICGGTYLMAEFGLLDGKKATGMSSGLDKNEDYFKSYKNCIVHNEGVVIDGNIITSPGQYFIEFGYELAKLMKVKEIEKLEDNYNWLKIKSS